MIFNRIWRNKHWLRYWTALFMHQSQNYASFWLKKMNNIQQSSMSTEEYFLGRLKIIINFESEESQLWVHFWTIFWIVFYEQYTLPFQFSLRKPNQYSISPVCHQIVNFLTKHLGFKITQLSFRESFRLNYEEASTKLFLNVLRHVDLHRNCLRAIFFIYADIYIYVLCVPMEDLCFDIIIRKRKFPYKIFITDSV